MKSDPEQSLDIAWLTDLLYNQLDLFIREEQKWESLKEHALFLDSVVKTCRQLCHMLAMNGPKQTLDAEVARQALLRLFEGRKIDD